MQIVYSIEQLQQLQRQWSRTASLRRAGEYVLDIPELTGAENDKLSGQIKRHMNACGCIAAGLCMGMAAIFLAVNYFAWNQPLAGLSLKVCLLYSGLLLSVSMVGKQSALIWSNFRLQQVLAATLREAIAIGEHRQQSAALSVMRKTRAR